MKFFKIIYFIAFSSIFSLVYSQDELVENTWYLEKLVINNNEIFPPISDEFDHVKLSFQEFVIEEGTTYFFDSKVCSPITGTIINMDPTLFSFFDISCCNDGETCSEIENINFENLYVNFYVNYFEHDFLYSINPNEDGSKILIIQNEVNDQAIYTNNLMTVSYIDKLNFKFYPNPVKDKLTFENPNLKITSVKLRDSSGKLVLTEKISTTRAELNLSSIPTGIYFILFEENGKTIETKKIIKK